MSGLSLQQGCICLSVFPVHMLRLGEWFVHKWGVQGFTWHKEGMVPGSFIYHSALTGAEGNIGDWDTAKKTMKCCDLIYYLPPLNLHSLPPWGSNLSWCWRGLLTRLFQGTVGGTNCTYQLAICHSDWSLCNNDIVVINLVIFLVGELAWALHCKPKRKPAAHLGRMPWKLCFVLHNVLLERIV